MPFETPSDGESDDGYEPYTPFEEPDVSVDGSAREEARLQRKRKRPWSERGLGVDWMLEQEAERAAKAALLRSRVLQAGRGVKRREMMSEPSRPPHARTRRAGE